jgi:hypothetical protein
MTKDNIIRMAREAGMAGMLTDVLTNFDELERFAALVAAAEREKVARWMMQRGYATGHGDTTEDLLVELEWQVRELERDACAKISESYEPRCDSCPSGVSNAIRARGQNV